MLIISIYSVKVVKAPKGKKIREVSSSATGCQKGKRRKFLSYKLILAASSALAAGAAVSYTLQSLKQPVKHKKSSTQLTSSAYSNSQLFCKSVENNKADLSSQNTLKFLKQPVEHKESSTQLTSSAYSNSQLFCKSVENNKADLSSQNTLKFLKQPVEHKESITQLTSSAYSNSQFNDRGTESKQPENFIINRGRARLCAEPLGGYFKKNNSH